MSTCEGVCGLTHGSRHAICADGEGNQVSEDEEDRCDQENGPPTEEECAEPSPPCEFSWYASQWSDCSSKCSGMMGLQSR